MKSGPERLAPIEQKLRLALEDDASPPQYSDTTSLHSSRLKEGARLLFTNNIRSGKGPEVQGYESIKTAQLKRDEVDSVVAIEDLFSELWRRGRFTSWMRRRGESLQSLPRHQLRVGSLMPLQASHTPHLAQIQLFLTEHWMMRTWRFSVGSRPRVKTLQQLGLWEYASEPGERSHARGKTIAIRAAPRRFDRNLPYLGVCLPRSEKTLLLQRLTWPA